jgi:phosphatidylserine decarboxylase
MFARGGFYWIYGTLLLSTVSLLYYLFIKLFAFFAFSVILIVFLCFFLVFFRDPNRVIGPGLVSPADGRVMLITSDENYNTKIAVFMNVTNVHVNRAPISGKVVSIIHIPGGFIPAYNPASEQNERFITTLQTGIGRIKIKQIAGIVAQRIVPYIRPGQHLIKGERIGMIQFGSRVDLIVPKNKIKVRVKVGDKVFAGSTTIADVIGTS